MKQEVGVAMCSETRVRVAMGTWVAIEAEHERRPALLTALEAGFAAVAEIERLMHPTRADGDLARINLAPACTAVAAHPLTWDVLRLARRLSEISLGAFDPCLPHRPGRITDVELLETRQVICHAPVAIDLGGIAKGYAVDRAVAALRAHGCRSGIVNAGGDLRVFGPEPRVILLSTGQDERHWVELLDESVAASTIDEPEHPGEHQGYYDRRGGEIPLCGSAAVIATEAVIADALVKCVLLADAATAQHMLDACGARLPVAVVSPKRLSAHFPT